MKMSNISAASRIRVCFIAVAAVLMTACGRVEHAFNDIRLKWTSPDPDEVQADVLNTEDYRLEIVTIATGLYLPWAIEFLPDGNLLVTEKNGSLFRISTGTGERDEIRGVPNTRIWGQGGLMDVVAHPSFAENALIYLTFAAPVENDEVVTRLVRARLDGNRLVDIETLFSAEPALNSGAHFGSALTIGDDGSLYLTSGERGVRGPVQDLDNHLGKIIRLTADGAVPPDNPFVGQSGARPEVFTLGHRNPQAILIEPASREIWAIEHGPRGGDEVNRLIPGANYGWPVVGYGREYDEDRLVGEATSREGIVEPIYYFDPSIATSGATFYTGDVFEAWSGDLLIGGLGSQLISRLEIEDGVVVAREDIAMQGRIRDIDEGPDGLLYVITDEGRLLQLRPLE